MKTCYISTYIVYDNHYNTNHSVHRNATHIAPHAESHNSTLRISPRNLLHSPTSSSYHQSVAGNLSPPLRMPITRSQLLALPSPKPPVRTTGIESWLQLVASSTRGSRRQLVPISSNIRARGPKPLKLKSRQPTTSGKRGTKRKSAIDNDQDHTVEEEGDAVMNPQVKKRGRGRRNSRKDGRLRPDNTPVRGAPTRHGRRLRHFATQRTNSESMPRLHTPLPPLPPHRVEENAI